MGLVDFTLRRLAPAAGASALAAWAGITTLNDDWDDYLGSAPAARAAGDDPERIVILSSGWAALNALRKCASAGRSVVVVSPRPHFLYTPLLASSSVGTITLRSACEPLRGLVESAAGRCAGATFVRADAREVDTGSKTVRATADADGMELEISYDKLIVAVGSQPNTFDTGGEGARPLPEGGGGLGEAPREAAQQPREGGRAEPSGEQVRRRDPRGCHFWLLGKLRAQKLRSRDLNPAPK